VAELLVLDSGVFVRWYLPQVGHEHARRVRDDYLAGELLLATPDLARVEVANVLRRKGLVAGLLSREDYLAAAGDIDALGVQVQPTDEEVLSRAVVLSADYMISVLDALFLDLAVVTGGTLVTADKGLASTAAQLVSTILLRGIGTGSSDS